MEHTVELKILHLKDSGLRKMIFAYPKFEPANEKMHALIKRYTEMEAVFQVRYGTRLVFDNSVDG